MAETNTSGAIVMTWQAPVRGREGGAIDRLRGFTQHLDELRQGGQINDHKEFFGIGGSPYTGLVVVEGQLGQLFELQKQDRWQQLVLDAQLYFDALTTSVFAGGDDISVDETLRQMEAAYRQADASSPARDRVPA